MDKKNSDELREIIKENYSNISGIIITENDETKYEDYFNGYNNQEPIHVASVTKSIISILIGIAINKKYIKSINDRVINYFPNYKIKRGENKIQEITIKDLLTMTAPYKYKYEPYTKVYTSDDWIKAALDLLGGKGEIGIFNYSTIGTNILSGILIQATGIKLLKFANQNLFKPLGINGIHNTPINNREDYMYFLKSKNISGWVVDPKGNNTAGWGLALTTREISKIGKLYLNRGFCNGKQIVSSDWIKESTIVHSKCNGLSYGYLWWIIEEDIYAAIGDGGNVIYINKKKNIVISITSSFKPRAKDRIDFIKKYIEPYYT